jgi:general secretion pathway protein F
MAVFEYKALAETGKMTKGIIDAETAASARRKLREQQLFPTEITESFGKDSKTQSEFNVKMGFSGVSTRDLSLMTRQLAVLLRAGMPLVESLKALTDQTSNNRLKKTIYDIRSTVLEGKTLADGLGAHPKVFSPLYVNMVRAGEASGSLEPVLFRLDSILDHQAKLKAKIISTLAYPCFMVLFAIALISFLTLVIMPKITDLFTKRDQQLPKITEWLMWSTDFISSYWYLIVAASVLLLVGWRSWVSYPGGRKQWDRFKLKVPLFGTLHLKLICGRFARILGTMLESGLTMMKALEVVNTIIGNTHIEATLRDVMADVRKGRGLSVPMGESGEFPAMLVNMIDLGQRSGELDDMLRQTADTYDDDVEVTIEAIVSLMEPVIIITMGVFVGLLVLSILMPILEMSSTIGG